jgi:hypothetical protein
MRAKRSLLLLAVLLLPALPACAPSPPVPPTPPPPAEPPSPPPPLGFYFVINNSAQRQICAFREGSRAWSAWFAIPPAGNWRRDNLGVGMAFQCRPPVRQQQYPLSGGRRYSLLPAPGGAIQLVEVTAGAN